MSIRISTKYRTSSDVNLLKFSYQISDIMDDNPIYTNSPLVKAVLQKSCDNFRVAGSIAGRKDRALLSAKDDRKADLIRDLDVLNVYVTETCKGDTWFRVIAFGKGNQKVYSPPVARVIQ